MRRQQNPDHPSRWLLRAARPAPLLLMALLAWSPGPALAGAADPAPAQELPAYLADRGPGISTSQFATYVASRASSSSTPSTSTRGPPPSSTTRASSARSAARTSSASSSSTRPCSLSPTASRTASPSSSKGRSTPRPPSRRRPATRATSPPASRNRGWATSRARSAGAGERRRLPGPSFYSFLEIVFPLQENKLLIGTQDWEGALGLGFLRGYCWGTIGGRLAVAWDGEDSRLQLGEYAVEYIKRTSPRWRFLASLEGESEEVSLIGEAQWSFSLRAFLKLNCGFGLTELSPDVAPEVGILFRF